MGGGFSSWIVVVRFVYTGVEDNRHLSIYMLRKERRDIHFDPPKLGDPPPPSELIAPSFVLLTTTAAAVAFTT